MLLYLKKMNVNWKNYFIIISTTKASFNKLIFVVFNILPQVLLTECNL